jgi:branched-chain amino acid transport system permease protein
MARSTAIGISTACYAAGPLQALTDGRMDAGVLRPLLVALVMVGMMLWRPQGIWPGRVRSGSGPTKGASVPAP